jgi:hypothetical protein
MSGVCTTPLPACHPLQTSSEHFKGVSNQVQSSYAVALSVFSGDREGGTVISRVAREPLGNASDPASDASRALMLGKHDRPLSQTSQGGSGNSDTTRPQRRLVCHVTLYSGTAVSMPNRNPPKSPGFKRLKLK